MFYNLFGSLEFKFKVILANWSFQLLLMNLPSLTFLPAVHICSCLLCLSSSDKVLEFQKLQFKLSKTRQLFDEVFETVVLFPQRKLISNSWFQFQPRKVINCRYNTSQGELSKFSSVNTEPKITLSVIFNCHALVMFKLRMRWPS